MKQPLVAQCGAMPRAWPQDSNSACQKSWLAQALSLGSIALLLVGISFVKGAVDENEPRAARTGLVVFGTGSMVLMALARAAGRLRNHHG